MSFVKIAKTNFVVIKLLLSGHKEESKVINLNFYFNFNIFKI